MSNICFMTPKNRSLYLQICQKTLSYVTREMANFWVNIVTTFFRGEQVYLLSKTLPLEKHTGNRIFTGTFFAGIPTE